MGFKSFAGLALAVALAGVVSGTAYAQTAASAPDTLTPAATAPVKKIVKPKKMAPKADAMAPAVDAAPKADAAKPKSKPKPKAAPTVLVTISNQRAVGAVEVDVAVSGSGESKKVASALAAGKKATVKIAHDKECMFDIHASFEDGATSDASGVNLCKEKKINLVE